MKPTTEEAEWICSSPPQEIMSKIQHMDKMLQLNQEQEGLATKLHGDAIELVVRVVKPAAVTPGTSDAALSPDILDRVMTQVKYDLETVGVRLMAMLLKSLAESGVEDALVEEFIAEARHNYSELWSMMMG